MTPTQQKPHLGRQSRVLWLIALAAFALGGCPSNTEIKAPPKPRRPKEKKVEKVVKSDVPSDCRLWDKRALPPSVPYRERSIAESKRLADEGLTLLERARNSAIGKIERESLITESVDRFLTALRADPYNVHATYNLAAAYARIDRTQCSANLLDRLVDLRKLRSQKQRVEAKLDRLLGRGRRNLDPDFRKMRDMDLFRELVKKFCPSLPTDAPLDRCR